jgi:hypothetical protein
MSTQRREHLGTLDQVHGTRDHSPTRDLSPYEGKVREIRRQKRRKRFAEMAATLRDPTLPSVRPWPGPRCGALPREVLLVDHAHTQLGQALYDIACEMRDKGFHLREARGRQPAIKMREITRRRIRADHV